MSREQRQFPRGWFQGGRGQARSGHQGVGERRARRRKCRETSRAIGTVREDVGESVLVTQSLRHSLEPNQGSVGDRGEREGRDDHGEEGADHSSQPGVRIDHSGQRSVRAGGIGEPQSGQQLFGCRPVE